MCLALWSYASEYFGLARNEVEVFEEGIVDGYCITRLASELLGRKLHHSALDLALSSRKQLSHVFFRTGGFGLSSSLQNQDLFILLQDLGSDRCFDRYVDVVSCDNLDLNLCVR